MAQTGFDLFPAYLKRVRHFLFSLVSLAARFYEKIFLKGRHLARTNVRRKNILDSGGCGVGAFFVRDLIGAYRAVLRLSSAAVPDRAFAQRPHREEKGSSINDPETGRNDPKRRAKRKIVRDRH
jgi:hypothetical protein